MKIRHAFLLLFLFKLGVLSPVKELFSDPSNGEWSWHTAAEGERHGRGWAETAGPFDRLPPRAEAVVSPSVWGLSRDSAGVYLQFITDAPSIQARWSLTRERLGMWHMGPSAVSGLDLYVKDKGRWRWAGVGRPEKFPDNEWTLLRHSRPEDREYRLYLPLYNGVSALEIGVPSGARLAFLPVAETASPIVIYGTSITQGACASRPGMAYPAILGRRLDRPVINLGFSGNGRTEPELAHLLAELNPAAYVIDTLPNLNPTEVRPRMEAFVQILREVRPEVPIVLVESIAYANAHISEPRRQRFEGSNQALREAHASLVAAGIAGLYYVESEKLLGQDGDDTVDGTHPTDIGLARIADGLEPVLRRILGGLN